MSKLFQCLCHYIGLYFLQGPSANYKAGIARKQQLLTLIFIFQTFFLNADENSLLFIVLYVMQNVS